MFFLPFLISRQEVYFYNNFLKTNLMVLEFIYFQQEIYSSFITNRQGRGGGVLNKVVCKTLSVVCMHAQELQTKWCTK